MREKSLTLGVFPSVDSYLRLVVSDFMENAEDWSTDYAYIKAEKVQPALENGRAQVAN